MTFFQSVDAGLIKILANLGQSFVNVDGATVACGITRPAEGNEPMEGGAWGLYSGSLFTRRALLAQIPVEGQTITVDGNTVYVGKVKSDTTSPLVTIPFSNEPPPR